MYDLVTFGEAMIRLSPPNFMRIEQSSVFDVNIGGGELNVAIGASSLGLKTAWISKLPLSPLGGKVEKIAKSFDVDTKHIIWDKNGRMGIYFLESGSSPRSSKVYYDRKYSSINSIKDNEIDWNNILTDTKVFHTSGITPALNENIAQIVQKAVVIGKKKGCLVSYDLNYRSKLWSLESAKKFTESLLQYIDILFTTEEDAEKVLCIKEKCYEDVAREIKKRYSINIIAITIRDVKSVLNNDWTAIVLKDEIIYKTNIYSCEIVDRIGAGDSFTAGFLFGILKFDIQKALDIGVAFSALKHSIPGDFNLVNINEVNDLIAGGSLRIQR